MDTRHPKLSRGLTRRSLLRAGLAAGATLSAEPLLAPRTGWAQQPKRGGILRVRGYDPPHFEPLSLAFKTNTTLSFVYSKLVRHNAPNPSFDYGNRAAALWLDR